MADNNVRVNLQFNADTSQAKKQIQDLYKSLQAVSNLNTFTLNMDADLIKAANAAEELEMHLRAATNVNTGKLNLIEFNKSLTQSQTSLAQLITNLANGGNVGQQAFAKLATQISQTQVPLRQTNALISNMMNSLKNTVKWELSSSFVHGIERTFSQAVSYVRDLNSSLNDIRIVTGQSMEDMARFAEQANKTAKTLSTTTKEYTDAALIFYQQGLDDKAVKERTDVVIKMANVTKDSAAEVSSYMTAIWNNFDDGAESLEHYADVITALGASTASSSAEIAAGLEKFASIGKTIGLSYEYATSALATLVANTRQSSETVGTGLRTLFSRLQGLKLGETSEDGVDLNKYSAALNSVGVQVLDQAGNLKEMDTILDDLASKWDRLSNAQQTALAQTVGGVRQFTNLISLMEHWDDMKENLDTAEKSTGSLQSQADIYAESWDAASKRVKTSMQNIYSSLIDEKSAISLLKTIEQITDGIGSFVKTLGGASGIVTTFSALMLKAFSGKIVAGVQNIAASMTNLFKSPSQQFTKILTDTNKILSITADGTNSSSIKATSQLIALKQSLLDKEQYLTSSQQATAQAGLDAYASQISKLKELEDGYNSVRAANERLIASIGQLGGQELDKIIKSFNLGKNGGINWNILRSNDFNQFNRTIAGDQSRQAFTLYNRASIAEGVSANAFGNVGDRALNGLPDEQKLIQIKTALESIQSVAQGTPFENYFKGLNAETLLNDSKALDEFKQKLLEFNTGAAQDAEALGQKLNAALSQIKDPQLQASLQSLKTRLSEGSISGAQALSELEAMLQKTDASAEKLKNSFQSFPTTLQAAVSSIANVASGMLMSVNAGKSLANTIKTLGDTSASGADKIGAIASSGTTAIMSLSMMISAVKGLAVAFGAAQAAAGWIGLIGAAIAGVVMWLSASSQAEAEAAKEAAEAAKKAHEESLKATQEIIDTKKAEADASHDVLKTFNELYAQKQAGQSVDEQLATAALNLAEAYGVTDTAMARLSGNYDTLIAKAKQYAIVQSEQDFDSARDTVTAAEGVVASAQINSSAYSDKQSFIYKQSPEWLIKQGYGGARLDNYATTGDAVLTGVTFNLYQPKSGTQYQVSGIKLTDKGGYSSSSGYNVIGDEGNDTYEQIAEQTGLNKYIGQYQGQASLLVSNRDSFEYRQAVYNAVGETLQLMREAGATNNSFYSGLLDYYASMADEMETYKSAIELMTTKGKNVLSAKLIGLENITNYADFEAVYQDLYDWIYENKDDLGIDSTLTGEDLTSAISNLVYDIICESTDLDLYTAVRGAIYEAFTPSNDNNVDFHREMAEIIARNYGVAAITDDILAEIKKTTPTEGVETIDAVNALMSSERGQALLSQARTKEEMAQKNVTQGQIVSAQGLLKKNMTSAESNSLYKSLLGSGVGWDVGETPEDKLADYGKFLALTYEEQQAYLEGLANKASLDLNAMAQEGLSTAQTLYDNAKTTYDTAREEHVNISDDILNSAISFVDSIGQTSFDQNGQLVYSGSNKDYATWVQRAWAEAQTNNPDISQEDFLANLPSQLMDELEKSNNGITEVVNAYLDLQDAQTGLDTAQIDAQTAAWNAQRVEVNQLTKDVTSLASFISKGPSSTSEWREFLRLMQETNPDLTMETIMGWDDSTRSSKIAAASAAKRDNAMSDSEAQAKYQSDTNLRNQYDTYEAWKTAYNTDDQSGTIMSDAEYAALVAQDNTIQAANRSTQFDADSQELQKSLSIAKEYQSVLSSIKLDSLATMGSAEWTRFSEILKETNSEYKDLTKEAFLQKDQLEQITAIAEAQAAEYKNQSDIYTELAKKAEEYAGKATTNEEKATWQAKQIEYQNLATQALIDSENAVTQSITDKIKVYEAAIDRLQKAENVDKQNAEKSKSIAETLTGAIETGALTEAQKTLLKSNGFDLDASGWNEAADATTRAAIAAKAWSTYANNIKSYGDELVANYNGAADAVEKLNDNIQKTVIGDKTNLPQLLTDNKITDKTQVGALLKAWDSLIAKGEKEASSITLADLAAEARSMGATITSEVDAAVAASTDAMNSIFHQMAQQHIASAQAAADAWKNAFTQIANFRKSLLEGDDILSQIAGNPEAFAQGLASYRKTHPNASAQQFYAAVANGNVKASDLKYTDFDINQYMADTGRSFVTKEHSIYSGTHFGAIIDENAMPSWAKTDRLKVGQMRIRDAQALVDNGQAADFSSAQVMLNDWYTAAFKKMVKEDGTAYTDNEIGALVTRIQQGDIEAYRLLSTGLDRIEDYAEITADASRLNTARQEATSALQGVQNDTTRTAEFRGQQRTESELNDLNAAINAAQKIKEQEGRWEDIDANSRRILEKNGITSFDGLSGAATDCAGALAVLAGAAEAAAQAQLGKVGTYKNGDEYGQILDKDGNLVQLDPDKDGKYDAAGFLAEHKNEGYTFNTDQATTTAMSTMTTTTQAALDTETDTKQSEILSEAKLAGFSSKEEQEEYIRLAVERNEIASAEEMIEQGICKTKEEALELQREYANQLRKCERGLKSLADNGKKWVKTVKDATASISDQSIAMKGLRQGYKDILNLSDSAAEALNAEFLTNSEMLKLAETAASDSGTKGQQALNKLQAAAAAAITPFDDMEVGLDKIAQAIADVNLQAGDLFADADYSMVDNYWNTVVDKCLASGDTIGQAVETANAALNSLGVDVNPQLEIVTETLDPAGFQAILEKTGTKTVTVPDGVGGTREVTYDEFKQIYEEAGSTPIPFTYVKGKGAPGANKYTKRAEKPGGGRGGRGGGGGGRGRDPRRANKINKKDNIERYHEIDNIIDDLADSYERLNKEEDRAWGKNRINAMQQETKILKDQIAAVEEKIRQAREWKKQDLSAALSAGWTFDANGNVNNYDEFLSSQIDKYNAAIDSYNNMSADAQEDLDKKYSDMTNKDGEYYSGYEDYLKQTLIDGPKEALEQYEETMELLEDLGMEYDDFLNKWHDNIIGQIQTKLDTTLEITEAQLGYLEHKLSRIEDDAYSAAEAIGLMGQQMDLAQAQFNAQKSALDNLLKAYSPGGTVWSAEDLMNGNISAEDLANAGMQSGDIKLIQTIMEGLMDASEQMSEQMSSSIEHMANVFEEFNSDMDRYISTVEHAQTITSTYRNIIDLTGHTMSKFNSTMLKSINDAIAAQSVANLEANKTKYETVKTEYDEAKAAYEAAQKSYAEGGIDAAALKAAKDTYQAAQDNMNEAQEAFLSSWEEALQAAADAFQSNMEAAVRDIGEIMSGGLAGGLAELEDAFSKMNEQDQNYVDDYEKIYQLTKMTRDLNDKIDSTSNVRAQKELLKYQKELNGLLESDQEMSSYDLDYLQKKLDLKLAEIALDEAQNAKSQVTMRRDSEGNYNYVYTADENAVAKAESDYANKLYEMQKANDEYITSLSENMANLSSQMLNEIAAIDTTIYDTEEKYQAEVQRITDHYTTQMEYYNSEMNKVLDNNKTLYEQDWTNFSKYTGYKISAEENYVTRWNQTVLSQVTGFETQEEFYENFNKAVFGEDPAHPSGESLIGRLVTAYKSMRDQITAANAAAGVETEDLATALLGNIEAATQEAEAAADGITDAATEIVSQITSIGDAVTDMVNNYSQAMATMEAETDAMLGVLLDFLTAYGEIGNLNIEPGVLAEIEARRRERQENPEGFDTGGYTGAWGSEGRLAYLHQKELVLNAEDTVNMLTSVGILRQIASIIDLNALASAGGFISLMSSGVGGNQGMLQQEVHIEASFPAVTDKNQIEEAFGDLVNLAAQYANRRV